MYLYTAWWNITLGIAWSCFVSQHDVCVKRNCCRLHTLNTGEVFIAHYSYFTLSTFLLTVSYGSLHDKGHTTSQYDATINLAIGIPVQIWKQSPTCDCHFGFYLDNTTLDVFNNTIHVHGGLNLLNEFCKYIHWSHVTDLWSFSGAERYSLTYILLTRAVLTIPSFGLARGRLDYTWAWFGRFHGDDPRFF